MNRILLADDSRPIRRVVELTLEHDDVELRTAENGSGALEILNEGFEPDLALVDVHMPVMDGIELCRKLRDRLPKVQVLLLVGTFEPFDSADGESAGAVGHLLKPFSADDLRQRIDDMLGRAEPSSTRGEETSQQQVSEDGDSRAAEDAASPAPSTPSMLTGGSAGLTDDPAESEPDDVGGQTQAVGEGEPLQLSEEDLDALARKVAGYLLENLSAGSPDELFARVVGDEVRKRIDQLERELADEQGED